MTNEEIKCGMWIRLQTAAAAAAYFHGWLDAARRDSGTRMTPLTSRLRRINLPEKSLP